MLAHLIEEVIPGEYYTTMISLTADINILLLFLSIAKNKLYQHLKKAAPGLLGSESIKWNFTKFLVDRDGKVVQRFAPNDTPESIAGDIEKVL